MTRVVSTIVLLVVPASAGLEAAGVIPASPCTFGWNQSQDASVTGYALYFWTAGSSTTNRQDAGTSNTMTLFSLQVGANYSFYVVAYNAAGIESPPSNLVAYTPQAISPLKANSPSNGTVNLQFRVAPGSTCRIQYTPSLNPAQWQVLTSAAADASGNIVVSDRPPARSRFYRVVLP